MPECLKTFNGKPRRVRPAPQHPSEESYKMHPQGGEVGLLHRDDTKRPANGTSDQWGEHGQALTTRGKPMSQQGTVRKESRGGTLTQRGEHVVIPFKKLDSLPQVSGPGPHRKPRQARRHRPREMEAKKARFGHIDSKAKASKQLKYLRKQAG